MYPRPISVKPLNDYKILVKFKNDEERIFDVKPYLSYPMYKPLENEGLFMSVKADGGCVYWNDDIDLCPDTIYEKSMPI